MHICQDEILAAIYSVPFLGYFVMKVRHTWHRVFHKNEIPATDGCCDEHEHE